MATPQARRNFSNSVICWEFFSGCLVLTATQFALGPGGWTELGKGADTAAEPTRQAVPVRPSRDIHPRAAQRPRWGWGGSSSSALARCDQSRQSSTGCAQLFALPSAWAPAGPVHLVSFGPGAECSQDPHGSHPAGTCVWLEVIQTCLNQCLKPKTFHMKIQISTSLGKKGWGLKPYVGPLGGVLQEDN